MGLLASLVSRWWPSARLPRQVHPLSGSDSGPRRGRWGPLLGLALAYHGALWAVACDRPARSPVERGAGIFLRSCASCHGPGARGGNTRLGLVPPPRDLTDPDFQRGVSDEALRRSIRAGKGMMPAFGGLMADEDVAALIAFIRSLSGRPR